MLVLLPCLLVLLPCLLVLLSSLLVYCPICWSCCVASAIVLRVAAFWSSVWRWICQAHLTPWGSLWILLELLGLLACLLADLNLHYIASWMLSAGRLRLVRLAWVSFGLHLWQAAEIPCCWSMIQSPDHWLFGLQWLIQVTSKAYAWGHFS